MSIPVTGVTLGQTSVVGSGHSFENTTDSFAPVGFESAVVSSGHFLYEGGGNGIVQFIFDTAYDEQTPLNIPFYFGPGLITTGLSAGDQTLLGGATVENVSASFAPAGFESSELGSFHRVYDGAGNGVIDFLFVDTYTQQSPLNIPFPFGVGGFVISGVSAGSDSRFGGAAFENTADQLLVEGIAPSNAFGIRPVVGFEPPVDFFFVDAYPTQTPLNIPFYFGPGLTLSAGDLLSSAVGGHIIENDAATVAPAGFESSEVARAFVYFDGQNGVNVDFKFVQSYNPGQGEGQFPNSLNVPFYFVGSISIQVGSIDSLEVGGIDNIATFLQIVEPGGIDSALYGVLFTIENAARVVANCSVGDSTVVFGEPVIGINTVYQFTPGFANEVSFGAETFLARYVRYLNLAGSGVSVDVYGDTWVAYNPRSIEPEGIGVNLLFESEPVGFPTVDFGVRTIEVPATADFWPSSTVSEGTTFQDDSQTLDSVSVGYTFQWGNGPTVDNFATLVSDVGFGNRDAPDGLIDVRSFVTPPLVYNNTRYLGVYWLNETYYPNEQTQFPKFGGSFLYNKNRTIVVQGITRNPYFTWGALTKIFNNARLVSPGAIAEQAIKPRWESDLFVAFAQRFLSMSGLDSLDFRDRYAPFVYNAAFAINPEGFSSSFVPKPTRVFDPTQFIVPSGLSPTLQFGDAWAAYNPRYVSDVGGIVLSYPAAGFPVVDFVNRLVIPEGIHSSVVSLIAIQEFFNKADPVGIGPSGFFGSAAVANVTPQLFPLGFWASQPFLPSYNPMPDPFIAYAVRTIGLDFRHSILPTNVVAQPAVELRNRTVFPRSEPSSWAAGTHKLFYLNVPTDFDQFISQVRVSTFSESPLSEASRFGDLEFRGPVEPEGIDATSFGDDTAVQLMGITYEWVTLSMTGSTFGVPTLVFPRFIIASVNNENTGAPLYQDPNDGPIGVEYNEGPPLSEFGPIRFSPWTIYLTQLDPPLTPQAVANNPGYLYEPIPTTINNDTPNFAWGRPKIFIVGVDQYVQPPLLVEDDPLIGLPVVSNYYRTLRLTDAGIFENPFGYPTFPFLRKIYSPPFQTPDDYKMGEDIVIFQEQVPFEQTISPPDVGLTAFGDTLIEFFNRPLPIPSLSSSVVFGDNEPMVHFPRGFEVESFDSFEEGEDTFIDFAIRYLQMDGFDSFTMENDGLSGEFNDRLRFEIGRLYIDPEGIDSFEAGTTTIDLRYQYIRCYMIPPPRCIGEDVEIAHL